MNVLRIVAGRNCAYALPVVRKETGETYTLGEGERFVFAIKRDEYQSERVLIKPITNFVDGAYYLELTPADTADLTPGWYKYDVALQCGESVLHTVVDVGDLYIAGGCAQLGDGA